MNKRSIRVNDQIRVNKIRLIDPEGNQVGVVPLQQGLDMAEQAGYDLVEVAPNASPPVCRIMDFGKYMYELSKKEKETKKKQHVIVTKEVRLRPKIEEHDFMFKSRHARKFIESGNRVKVSLLFRGREMVHKELGFEVMKRFIEELSDIAKVDKEPKMEGMQIIAFLSKK